MIEFRDLESEVVYSNKDQAYTNSKIIAKSFERRHDNVLKLIKEAIADLQSVDYECKPELKETLNTINQPNGGVRKEISYELDRDGFMFVVMKMKGKKADLFKLKFIQAFNNMEQWIKDRAVGRGVRLSMTDAIKEHLPETPNKKFKYKHFTDLVYKIVLGMNTKQIKDQFGEFKSLREICTDSQLVQIQGIENEISVLIKYGMTYKEIKDKLNK
ncbi:MAG: Rha family transcriptional regulator [Aureibaculum sp.]|nr:Rha family transcriptional regulator [Aureibaculum sp.]